MGFPQVLQGLHICILSHVPDLDAAVVGSAVQLVCALSEGQALRTDGQTGHSNEDAKQDTAAWPHRHCAQSPQLTETASRCPVKMCRRLQVAASQIMISLFLSPVAWQAAGDT